MIWGLRFNAKNESSPLRYRVKQWIWVTLNGVHDGSGNVKRKRKKNVALQIRNCRERNKVPMIPR